MFLDSSIAAHLGCYIQRHWLPQQSCMRGIKVGEVLATVSSKTTSVIWKVAWKLCVEYSSYHYAHYSWKLFFSTFLIWFFPSVLLAFANMLSKQHMEVTEPSAYSCEQTVGKRQLPIWFVCGLALCCFVCSWTVQHGIMVCKCWKWALKIFGINQSSCIERRVGHTLNQSCFRSAWAAYDKNNEQEYLSGYWCRLCGEIAMLHCCAQNPFFSLYVFLDCKILFLVV